MGRTKFNEQLRDRMISLYQQGKTDAQVARLIGVSRKTLFNWRGKDSDLLHTIKEAKAIPDDLVEASMFSRATGYSHVEEKIFVYEGAPVRVRTIKQYPPDVTAGIFWLCNRQPDRWKRGMMIAASGPTSTEPASHEKVSFDQFCINSAYPKPYAKQHEMMEFGFSIADPRMLLGARGYGKTDYDTILGTAYDVYMHGVNTSNLIISKSKIRNAALIGEIADALEKNGVVLDKRNSSVIRVAGLIGKDHSVEVLTIKSSFRGRHPKRIIMDDPVTEEDTSEATRALVKKKYDEAYKLCRNICIIGQPAHAFDLYAELRPSLKLLEVPHGTIPELDADLEAMRLAGVDPASIEMSYHLRIPSEGTSIFANLNFIDQFPQGDSVAFLDPSDGGDYTAITMVRGYLQGVAAHGHAWKKAWYHCLDDLVPILQRRGVKKLWFETNATGTQPIVQLRDLLAPLGISVEGTHSDSNKHAIISAAGSVCSSIHLSRESDKVYTDMVVKYELKSKFDDAPDSLARCLERLGLLRGKR